jgi:hypothetical protein
VLGNGPPKVVVGRYADVHCLFSDTETFKSEVPRGPGWEQFNKVMFALIVTQMDVSGACCCQHFRRAGFFELGEPERITVPFARRLFGKQESAIDGNGKTYSQPTANVRMRQRARRGLSRQVIVDH